MIAFNNAGDYPTYHSVFDNYNWMSQFGDPGFHRHVAVSQVWGAVALTLAEARDLPLNYVDYAAALTGYVQDVRRRLARAGGAGKVDLAPMVEGLARLEAAALQVERERRRLLDGATGGVDGEQQPLLTPTTTITATARDRRRRRRRLRADPRAEDSGAAASASAAAVAVAEFVALRQLNDRLMLAERGFLDYDGLTGPGEAPLRAWLRHLVFSPPQGNEYGSTAWANVVDAIEWAAAGGGGVGGEEAEAWRNVQHQVWRAGRALDRVAMVLRGRLL